uniref:NTR domain-containing protein n=1 Tax=Anolis carolinensis TaxID=28377 RepID=A0A803TRE9_ANOCA
GTPAIGQSFLVCDLFLLCSYSMIVPSVLWVESEQRIVVEAHGLSVPTEVTISVHNFPQKRNSLYQIKAAMNPANDMMVTPLIKVPAKDLNKDSKKNQYVIVQATCPQFTLEKVVLVSFQSGYILTQTDKTIYKPGSSGRGLPKSILISEFYLGTWNVVTKYEDSPQKTFRTPFDVKEYGRKNSLLYSDGDPHLWNSLPNEIRSAPSLLIFREKNIVVGLIIRTVDVGVIPRMIYMTPGSDMVVAERGGINIVTSPYQIHFTKTPKFFKPGMPYKLMVFVTNPDGSPAARVPVVSEPIRAQATTQKDGTANLVLNTPADTQELKITVKTDQVGLPDEHQGIKTMLATAYQTQKGSGNYLHLAVSPTEIKSGDYVYIHFNIRSNNPNQIRYFTYMILSKGKILKVGRQSRPAGRNLVTMLLSITPNLIPSFRIVAYYQVGNSEIVADSVWVDVKDTCMGKLVIKGATADDNRIHRPGEAMKIKVEGDPNARVGLVAVDKAVYVLNKNNKISQTMVWDTVEKSDIGCTAGSGRNNVGVFEDAGLALETSNKLSTKQRSGRNGACPQHEILCKEADETIDHILSCCKKIAQTYYKQRHNYVAQMIHWNLCDHEEFFMDEDDIVSRTEFPESWLWETKVLTEAPNHQGISSEIVSFYLKDSITTWEVLAVSISETKGICVADPYEITVMKNFFIDLRLPYSVVRNEQVAIQTILYNYGMQTIKVRVELIHNPAFCSASTAKQHYRHDVTIRAQSSTAVPFVLVPLKLGLHDVEVKAAVWNMMLCDGVKKKLQVVVGIALDGVQEVLVKAQHFDDIVPGTEPEIKINIQGILVDYLLEESIDGSNLKYLIITPYGHGEINMITISYCYVQQMVFKKPDHSYAAWINRPSSTWLTAYVVKVFTLASKIVSAVNEQIICGGVKWLVMKKQKPDGIFHEDAPVIHGELVGGYKGAESDTSLTAFVLVALLESRRFCEKHFNVSTSVVTKIMGERSITGTHLSVLFKTLSMYLGGNRWEEYNSRTNSIEGTSYALLALLRMKKFERTGIIIKWLTEQKYYGGTFGQTQATIIMFQALAQYEIGMPTHMDWNLNVAIKFSERQDPIHYRIDGKNELLVRTAETKINGDVTVRASGQGKAMLVVTTLYYAQMKAEAAQCKKFTLDVTYRLETKSIAKLFLGNFFSALDSRYLGDVDATNSIIDVSMLTGFAPNVDDLNRLSEGVGRHITNYEINKSYSERGNLIIYLEEVSHTNDVCVQFRAHQFFEVGLIQPASVKVYSYYNLDEQCIKFYHLPKESGLLNKICHGDVCRCAEENCSLLNHMKTDIDFQQQFLLACQRGVDYGELTGSQPWSKYLFLLFCLIPSGTDPNPEASPRKFISQMRCRETLNLKENNDYLISGVSSDLWLVKNDVYYLISKNTWIERWPSEDECQDEELQDFCDDLDRFSDTLIFLGCQV